MGGLLPPHHGDRGMMKMASSDGFPLRQGAKTGSRLVFRGYRGLRRRNFRSILFLDGFRVYGYILAKEVGQGGHEGPTRGEGTPRGVGAPPASWPPCLFLDVHSKSCGSRLFQKSCSRRFHSVWTPFDIPFLRNTEIGKKQQFALGLGLIG